MGPVVSRYGQPWISLADVRVGGPVVLLTFNEDACLTGAADAGLRPARLTASVGSRQKQPAK